MRASALVLVLALVACGGSRGGGGDDDDDDAGDGDADGDADDPRCLDAAGDPTDACAVDPAREACDLDETEGCAPPTLIEVWADDGESGPCLHFVAENGCDETLYSWTCIEHDQGGGTSWQCWLSTTLLGGEVDVSQCAATGRWAHYGSTSSGTLDVIDARCNPRDE